MTKISNNAQKILRKRYLSQGETWEDLCSRVARRVADDEPDAASRNKWFDTYRKVMQELDFLPNSPTLFNFGRNQGCGSACFVLPLENSRSGIFKTLSDAVEVQTYGGGTGFDFSRLAPRGFPDADETGPASGPIAFMKIFDYTIGNLTRQSGLRHGANMGILRIDHPDIEEFIASKAEEGQLNNFNISVGLTDLFIQAVKDQAQIDLVFDNQICKTVHARLLWDMIIDGAWKNGEPGVVFLDTINRKNPLHSLGRVEATNPCGEQPLLPYSSCNLGSVNLSRMIRGNWLKGNADIDWTRLEQTTAIAVRFLDSVISVNRYPVPEIKRVSLKTRQIGLGIMGFADLCIKLHIRYGSPRSIQLAGQVMQLIYDRANETSIALGKEKGTAPVYREYPLNSPARRNATLTSIAPTGTLSLIADCSSGCEPHFAFDYTRKCLEGEKLDVIPGVVREWVKNGDTVSLPNFFVTAHDVAVNEHIQIQAAFQNNGVDSAVSKTINAPYGTDRQEISEAFFLAWELGCKGITFYRTGSREEQALYTEKKRGGK